MFEKIEAAPPDAILGLNEAFQADPNPDKVNLSVGVYSDESGTTPVLDCVKTAERQLIEQENTKKYLGIDGLPTYGQRVPRLMLGENHPAVKQRRFAAIQTPGGTAALRVAGDWMATSFPKTKVWLSTPTWPNHPSIFQAAHVETASYEYYSAKENDVDFDRMCASLENIPAGDVVLLHGCCHNPTGADLDSEQWKQIALLLKRRSVTPLVDFAYQGFADGIDQDASGLRILAEALDELIVCSSFSKNFGLYRERVGALTVITGDSQQATAVLSRLKKCVRSNYSNPPSHGASVVSTILDDASLNKRWLEELATMRDRINSMRASLAHLVTEKECPMDFSFMHRQRGMFSLTGLSPEQVERLRQERAVYLVGNGRINLAGLNEQNVEYVADSIIHVAI